MLKRHVGRLLAAGVLSSGLGVAAANPASAMPRNGCLDEQHWWAQLSQLTQAAQNAEYTYESWDDAHVFQDDYGVSHYYVILPNGQIATGDNLADIPAERALWHDRWDTAFTTVNEFYNEMAICSL
jgi:hypothetical protein